jgi:uncharacterized membrane protein YvlD (DUF360 family)
MRMLINALITFGIFWVGTEYFHEHIQIQDTKTMILATVFMSAMSIAYAWFMTLSFFTIPLGIGCITFVAGLLLVCILTPVKLLILDRYLPGFNIDGFWTYILMSVVLSITTIKGRSSSDNNS